MIFLGLGIAAGIIVGIFIGACVAFKYSTKKVLELKRRVAAIANYYKDSRDSSETVSDRRYRLNEALNLIECEISVYQDELCTKSCSCGYQVVCEVNDHFPRSCNNCMSPMPSVSEENSS